MRRFSYSVLGLVLLLLCSTTASVYANIVLAEETFDSGVGNPTWGSDQGFVAITHGDDGGDGFLNIQYDADRGEGAAESIVYTDADLFFTGAWDDAAEDGAWIAFDFWADENTPYDFELRFEGASGTAWRYNLSTASLGSGWTSFDASLTWSDSLWEYGEFSSSSEAVFLSDLGTIDWIGIYINDDDTAANNYGLDNWQLMVPEPGEYAMAFSALAVTWLSLRRKKKSGAAAAS